MPPPRIMFAASSPTTRSSPSSKCLLALASPSLSTLEAQVQQGGLSLVRLRSLQHGEWSGWEDSVPRPLELALVLRHAHA